MKSAMPAVTASCPKIRTEPKAQILEALSKFEETRRRGTGSVTGAPEHPFRPAGAPELLYGFGPDDCRAHGPWPGRKTQTLSC